MKEIKIFKQGDQIPETAKFLCTEMKEAYFHGQSGPPEKVFYYECKIKAEKIGSIPKAEINIVCKYVIGHLNMRTGKNFSSTGSDTVKKITHLIKTFTEGDIVQAIDNMVESWGDDPKMSQYLRPSTLFQASKFENYLNMKSGSQQASDAFAELEGFIPDA